MTTLRSPLRGTVVAVLGSPGDRVGAGHEVVLIESMKMEHPVTVPVDGEIAKVHVAVGETVAAGAPLVDVADAIGEPAAPAAAGRGDRSPTSSPASPTSPASTVDPAQPADVRADVADVIERHAIGLDARRPEAVERRRARGQRTARENVYDLLDEGSFLEYGPLAVALQRRRRTEDDLRRNTPADGMIGGIGTVDGQKVVVASYDATVLAGTQGWQNHRKKDRLFQLAADGRTPVVMFAEGGGGRPGDVDAPGVAGLDCLAFKLFAELSGTVPIVGITSGFCFAGNAALLGCCDVIIATEGSSIGMGGPAMIEGGGLGSYSPAEIGPYDVQMANGVIDIGVADEAEAVAVAKRYLSYFRREPVEDWMAADAHELRGLVPDNRVRPYDIRAVVATLADHGSVLELRRGWAPGMVTALVRIEGRPLGLIANNPMHLGGAIDADGADKAARFMQLCDAHDLPILQLCDTPGFMVGPEIESRAQVRHVSRMFVVGANVSVPTGTIVLRKGYGLGAQAMAGGSFKAPRFLVSWPTGEFGGMGLEGAVRLGFRKELDAAPDDEARTKMFDAMVERSYAIGRATNMASHFEIDDVIDPADTRRWVSSLLTVPRPPRTGPVRPCVDTW